MLRSFRGSLEEIASYIESTLLETGFSLEIGGSEVISITCCPILSIGVNDSKRDKYRVTYTTNYPQVYHRIISDECQLIREDDPTTPTLVTTARYEDIERFKIAKLSLHPNIIAGIPGEDQDYKDGYIYVAEIEVPIYLSHSKSSLTVPINLNEAGVNRRGRRDYLED